MNKYRQIWLHLVVYFSIVRIYLVAIFLQCLWHSCHLTPYQMTYKIQTIELAAGRKDAKVDAK